MKYLTLILLIITTQITKAQKQKTIVLTFDDAPQSHYRYVAPLLKQYHFNATFYVCEFPGVYPDTTKSLNWNQIKQISQMGFEIGNHTWHHTSVKNITKEKFNTELQYIEKKCDSLHIPKPTSFCYPGYTNDSNAVNILKQNGYTNARTGGERTYQKKKDDPYYIPSYTITSANKDHFYKALLDMEKDKGIAIFCFHGVPDQPHPWVSTDQSTFKEYLDYLKTHRYKVIAMKDLKFKTR